MVDLLGVGPSLCGGSVFFFFRRAKLSISEKNSSVGNLRQVTLRDVYRCVHVCVYLCKMYMIDSVQQAPCLAPPHLPLFLTQTHVQQLLVVIYPGPDLDLFHAFRLLQSLDSQASSHWPSTQPQPPSTGRQAKWLELLSGAKSPDCCCLCCFCIVIITDGM